MGNKILGKRSRTFYKGFNERQLDYIKQKFSTMSEKNSLNKALFKKAYHLNDIVCEQFYNFVDFDENNQIDQYQFICAVHTFCNMTVSELGALFFDMCTKGNKKGLKQSDLENFTDVCLKYNGYLEKTTITETFIKSKNKDKFKKYDFDKSQIIDKEQFIKMASKDQDYKKWMFNMGFITKNQLDYQDQIYDLVDSDIENQIQRHLNQTNPNVDKIKRGIQHRIDDDEFEIQEAVGQQSVPVKAPWLKSIAKCELDKSLKQNHNSPSQSLTLSHIFGYRSYDCRNNAKFDAKGNIIYHQGSVGIVMSEKDKKLNSFKQNYMNEHKDDISCLEVVQNLAVTGEVGSKPVIMVWETDHPQRIQPKLIVQKGLKQSIGNICLSKTKRYLAANCDDPEHTLVIYDLEQLIKLQKDLTSTKSGIVASGTLTKYVIFDLKFTANTKMVVVATLKQLIFVSFQKGTLNGNRGQFNNFSTSPSLCLLPLEINYKGQSKQFMLSGMANGSVYFWEEDKCVKAVCGHSGSVSALATRKDNGSFVSGDKSGKIIVWNSKLQKQFTYTVPKTNCPSNMIVSLSTNTYKELLVGTKSSNLYKMPISQGSFNQAQTITSGHSDGHIWGLAVDHQQKSRHFYTGGQDQRLIKWQYGDLNKLLIQKKCSQKIRSLDYNHLNNTLVVGYINGLIELFDEKLEKKQITYSKIRNPDQQTLNLVKMDTKGNLILACYSYPKFVVKILKLEGKNLRQQCQIEFKEKIVSADFDKESKYIRVNTANHDYQAYSIQTKTGKKIEVESKEITKAIWATHSTILSPQTQGFKTEGVQQSDIICCQRSRKYRNVFIIGDKYSKLKLFNFPCKKFPIFNKYNGHSNQVTAVQFNKEQDYVISIGGEQKSIIVWKYDPDEANNQAFFQEAEEQEQVKESDLKEAKGDQAGANKPFLGQTIPPSDFAQKYNPRRDNKLPKQQVNIKHVFGLRNQYVKDEVRNQCKFSQDFKHILFPTACLGVKMNIKTRQQQFFHEHKQDIVSFAVDSNRQLMATGQMAQKNSKDPRKKILSIYVWDIQNKKVLKKLDGFHTIAVVLLQFSPSGKLLFSVGNDTKNSFAVYDWKSGSIMYSGPVSNGKVNGICWKSQTQFMTVGNDHVKLWTGGKGKQGKFPQKPQPMFCCLVSKNVYITGSRDGNIYNWNFTSALKAIKAHTGKVQCLAQKGSKVYSGGDDGIILMWKRSANGQIEIKEKLFDTRQVFLKTMKAVSGINEDEHGVLSLDFSQNQVLIATKGASVICMNQSDTNSAFIVHQGHYKGELWALGAQPGQNHIITGGDDKSVRIWDLDSKQQVQRVYFPDRVRGLDWQNGQDKKIIIADSRARLYLYNRTLSKQLDKYTGKPFKQNQKDKIQPWVEDIKFSPDSSKICYGTHAKSRYLELVSVQGDRLKQSKEFLGGSSALLHLDWSTDSNSIAINTQAYQYLFYDQNGQSVSASSLKDQKWATWTRKFGFQAQGVFQGVDYTDVNTVCRDPSSEMMAVGYDDQTIRLFKYPCYIPKQVHKTFYGHSSHVTKIKFTSENMVSIGGLDRTIIVWNVEGMGALKDYKNDNDGQESDGLDDLDEDVDLPNKAIIKKKKKEIIEEFYQVADEGDEFMAVKPWLGAIKQPTYKYPKQTTQKPNVKLELDYVFGYRCKDCRQNLFYVDDITLLFHAAAVLIYHNTKVNTQNLITQHNDDILSIDYNKKSGRVLTGELGPKPIVCLYEDGKFVNHFKAPVTKGVIAVSISPDGRFGVCVGMNEVHHVAVLDLDNNKIIAKQQGGRKIILNVKWVNDRSFVTVGINHYRLWNYEKGKLSFTESRKRGNYVSVDADDQLILTGGSKGSLCSWKGNSPKTEIILKAYNKDKKQNLEVSVIQCVKIMDNFVACGTKDGYVIFLDKNLKQIKDVNMDEFIKDMDKNYQNCQNSSIRSIDFLKNKMIVGTFGAEIYEMQIDSKFNISDSSVKNILKCHYSPNNTWTNQVWGLSITGDHVFTCSDDATLRYWSLADRKLLYCTSLNIGSGKQQLQMDKKTKDFRQEAKGRAVALSPDHKFVVVGCKDGTVRVFKFTPEHKDIKLQFLKLFKHAKQWISDIKFGYKTLIIGSHDNGIYVYDFEQDGSIKRKYRPMKKHSSYITHMDVSRDSCFLQSTCGAYELLFWDLNSGKQMTSGASMLKDQRWASWTCNLGWPVQGIYPKCTDGTFINSVDRSNLTVNKLPWSGDKESNCYLAAGNDSGKVCVYNYPCTIKSSNYVEGKGHSSHVTNVRWNNSDEFLTSVGGEDQCLMIWKVVKN